MTARGAPETIPLFTGALPADNPFAAADAPARSLNRARLVALPGVEGVAALLGHSASELLSKAAVTALARDAAGPLALDPAAGDLLRAFDGAFASAATRPAALAVAEEVGRRLGALLLTLWRGDAANRAARPEWDDAHWAYWANVKQVVVGGGLWAQGGLLTIKDGEFSGNVASDRGGAVSVDQVSEATITDSSFTGNGAPLGGGLSARSVERLEVSDALFDGDTASLKGGGLHLTQVNAARIPALGHQKGHRLA